MVFHLFSEFSEGLPNTFRIYPQRGSDFRENRPFSKPWYFALSGVSPIVEISGVPAPGKALFLAEMVLVASNPRQLPNEARG
jgi:hypothetical protein